MMNTSKRGAKTEEIKVRVEPLLKLSLVQISNQDGLDVSVIVRRALTDYATRRQIQPLVLAHGH